MKAILTYLIIKYCLSLITFIN